MMWLIDDAITTNEEDYIYMNTLNYETFIVSCIHHNSILNLQSTIMHFRTHDVRVYFLIVSEHILQIQKLNLWAHINYLVEYKFINIFCIWILSQNKIIKTQDIRFNKKIFYSLNKESDLTAILQKNIDQIIKIINVSHNYNWFF